jgi:HD-GYP domain-containing protein (c-di-GMP phosphodiesterase class II)
MGVADVLDALTSDRAYRKGVSLEEALKTIEKQAGHAFDPAVVRAAVELHEKGELALPATPNPGVPPGDSNK